MSEVKLKKYCSDVWKVKLMLSAPPLFGLGRHIRWWRLLGSAIHSGIIIRR